MYQKPKIFIINKNDMEKIKALAGSVPHGCTASGLCTTDANHASSCRGTPGSEGPSH